MLALLAPAFAHPAAVPHFHDASGAYVLLFWVLAAAAFAYASARKLPLTLG